MRALLRGVGHWRHVESAQSDEMYPKRLAKVCGCLVYSRTWTLEQTSDGIQDRIRRSNQAVTQDLVSS